MLHEIVNRMFEQREEDNLRRLFDIQNAEVTAFINNVDLHLVHPAVGDVLIKQKEFLAVPSIGASLGVLQHSLEREFPRSVIKQLIHNALAVRAQALSMDPEEARKANAECKGTLFQLFRKCLKARSEFATLICNTLCSIHQSEGQYTNIHDIINLNDSIPNRPSDRCLFEYYRGLSAFQNRSYYEAQNALRAATAHPHGRAAALPLLLSLLILDLPAIQPQSRWMIKSSANNGHPGEYSAEMLDVTGRLNSILPGISLASLPTPLLEELTPLLYLQEVVQNGLCSILDRCIPREMFRRYGILHVMDVDLPYICMRNLLYRIYVSHGSEPKFSVEGVAPALGISPLEAYRMVLVCIHKKLVKGYLSVAKGILVVSRSDPFMRIAGDAG